MKKFFILLISIFIGLKYSVNTTNSYFHDEASLQSRYESGVILDFYENPSNENEIGFELQGTSNVLQISYKISYEKEGGIDEVIAGTVYNLTSQDEIKKEWFYLGTCSGSVCVSDNIDKPIQLEIDILKSDLTTSNLSDSLTI